MPCITRRLRILHRPTPHRKTSWSLASTLFSRPARCRSTPYTMRLRVAVGVTFRVLRARLQDMAIVSRLQSVVLCAALGLGFWTTSRAALAGADPYLGEIETFAFNFCPKGWAALNGQLLPINVN